MSPQILLGPFLDNLFHILPHQFKVIVQIVYQNIQYLPAFNTCCLCWHIDIQNLLQFLWQERDVLSKMSMMTVGKFYLLHWKCKQIKIHLNIIKKKKNTSRAYNLIVNKCNNTITKKHIISLENNKIANIVLTLSLDLLSRVHFQALKTDGFHATYLF